MPQERSLEAFIWQGNPRKWHGSGTMDSYVADKSQYVYWATPQCRNEIGVGDKAFIWRALGEGPRGIITTGTVAETPRLYSTTTLSQFKHPHRVGIGEEAASSTWKTGISISEVRLRVQTGMLTAEMLASVCPDLRILKMPQGTVYRLNAGQCQKIERLWASARSMASSS
jgi:hypothetical protein